MNLILGNSTSRELRLCFKDIIQRINPTFGSQTLTMLGGNARFLGGIITFYYATVENVI